MTAFKRLIVLVLFIIVASQFILPAVLSKWLEEAFVYELDASRNI